METILTYKEFIISLLPEIAALVAFIISAIKIVKQISLMIKEFSQSNELKENNIIIKQLLIENEELKSLYQQLLIELTRIKPKGWTDDNDKNN